MISVPRSQRGATDRTAPLVIGVVSIILLLVIASIDLLKFDALMGMITVLILAIITVPLLRWVARRDDPGVIKILFWGLVLKTVFTMVRYFVITVIYGDNGDAGVYAGGGAVLMDLYRHGHFVLEVPQLANRGAETNRIAVVVGAIYLVTGVSRYAASFVFSWLCFVAHVPSVQVWRPRRRLPTVRNARAPASLDAVLAVVDRQGSADGVLYRGRIVRRCETPRVGA